MDVFHAYSFGTAGWLALQAAPLVAAPRLIIALLSPDIHQSTSLEEYFARSLGFAVLALSLLCLLLTGVIPVTTTGHDFTSRNATTLPVDAYASPTIILTMMYHSTTAVYSYTRFNRNGQSSYVLAALASASLASMGLWALLFGGGGRISKRTGADKRTSGFPFRNVEANKRKAGKKSL